jgi:hypothetical protein
MLLAHHPFVGNLRVYDVTKKVNIHKLQPDFDRLTLDVYVKEGFRKKHIKRILKHDGVLANLPLQPLYQSGDINPTHGNIDRVYPEYIPGDPVELGKLIRFFIAKSPIPETARLLIQAQRITCSPQQQGLPAVEGWHRDGVTAIGVACINRHNIDGGVSEFRDNKTGKTVRVMLKPGQIVLFDDTQIMHQVTPINIQAAPQEGHRDVILMSYPDCS